MASRSHLDPQTQVLMKALPQATLIQIGSSVKFCWIADGKADLYPRLAPTHDWDIAAGHAILQAAGGNVTSPDGSPVVYGTKELLIPAFVGRGGIKD
jgi:3'(2'), 5'-bisphosphate nucleotidase